MKRTVYFPEIFEEVGNAETKEEKIAVLHKYRKEKGFYDILRLCYEPQIHFLVTRAEVENLRYDHMDIADYDLAPTTLFLEARRRLYNWTNVRKPHLQKNKILRLVADTFSVLHHKEIELLKQIIDGNITEVGLDEGIVREAFPNLLSGEFVPPEPPKKKRGRPPGSKNKPKKRGPGRPKGSKNKPKTAAKNAPAKKVEAKVEDDASI